MGARTIFSDYKGINSIETLINTLGPLLKLTPEEINTYSQVAKQNEVAKSALALKKHSLYFLEANVALISKFTPLLQAQLLEVKTRIGYMNQTVDEANYYFRLSFQNEISSTNYEIANSNMIGSYKMYATQSVVRIIKDVISRIVKISSRVFVLFYFLIWVIFISETNGDRHHYLYNFIF